MTAAADRDGLLAAASELFAERGYHDTSVSDIAIRAGMSVGSVYNHLPGKAAILLAVFRDYDHRQEQRTKDAVAIAVSAGVEDPIALFNAATHAYLIGVWRERRLSTLFTSLSAPDVDISTIREVQGVWRERNARLLGLDDRSPRSAALTSALTGAIGGWVQGVQQCSDEDAALAYIEQAVALQRTILQATTR